MTLGSRSCWSKIRDHVTVQGDHIEYFNMMPVFKLSVSSHTLISLYQLYSHTCWVAGKLYHSLNKQLHQRSFSVCSLNRRL